MRNRKGYKPVSGKKELPETLIKRIRTLKYYKHSNRRIAEFCNVSTSTVSKYTSHLIRR